MLGIVGQQAEHGALGQREVLQRLLLEDACIVESVGEQLVGGGHHLLGHGYLLEVVFALVGVVLERVLQCLLLVGEYLLIDYLAQQAVVVDFVIVEVLVGSVGEQGGLVADAPVVLVLALSPSFLELLHALGHGGGVVEVPFALLCRAGSRGRRATGSGRSGRAGGIASPADAVLSAVLQAVACGALLLLLLLLLQSFDYAVDSGQPLGLVHPSQGLEAVLQLDGAQVGLQLGQYLAAAFALLVFVMLLVQDGHTVLIRPGGVDVVLHLPI